MARLRNLWRFWADLLGPPNRDWTPPKYEPVVEDSWPVVLAIALTFNLAVAVVGFVVGRWFQ